MNKTATFGLVLGFVCATVSPLSASINKREHNEQVRIRQGIRSGEVTRAEARRLEAEQARIRVDERFARADGNLTLKERHALQKELNKASRDIYHQKHDRQDRN
ncbi:MAG TPA: hypothetical protein VE422_34545 [Terriglobia bacterium]|nr:hypothetical protein [Terriglobia bacterium]